MKLHTQLKQMQSRMDRLVQPNLPPVIIYNTRTGKCSHGLDWTPGMPYDGIVIYRDDPSKAVNTNEVTS